MVQLEGDFGVYLFVQQIEKIKVFLKWFIQLRIEKITILGCFMINTDFFFVKNSF